MTNLIVAVAVVSLCLVLLAGTGALSQEPAYGPATGCLAQHKEDLTPDCKLRVAEAVVQMKEVQQTCQTDIMRFCATAKPGGGQGADCVCLQAGDRYNRDTCICH